MAKGILRKFKESKSLRAVIDSGSATELESALDAAPDIDEADDLLNTPLHYAVSRGNMHAAIALLRKGADVNARNRFEDTPLMMAIRAGIEPLVRLLLRSGADPGIRNRFGLDACDGARAAMFQCGPTRRPILTSICRLLESGPTTRTKAA